MHCDMNHKKTGAITSLGKYEITRVVDCDGSWMDKVLRLRFQTASEEHTHQIEATIGGIVEVDKKRFYLTPAQFFAALHNSSQ